VFNRMPQLTGCPADGAQPQQHLADRRATNEQEQKLALFSRNFKKFEGEFGAVKQAGRMQRGQAGSGARKDSLIEPVRI